MARISGKHNRTYLGVNDLDTNLVPCGAVSFMFRLPAAVTPAGSLGAPLSPMADSNSVE